MNLVTILSHPESNKIHQLLGFFRGAVRILVVVTYRMREGHNYVMLGLFFRFKITEFKYYLPLQSFENVKIHLGERPHVCLTSHSIIVS